MPEGYVRSRMIGFRLFRPTEAFDLVRTPG